MKRKIKVFLLYCMIFVNIIPMTVNAKEKHSDMEYKAYNITPDSSISLYDLAVIVREVAGKPLHPIVVSQEGMGLEYSGDNSRLKSELDLNLTPLALAIRDLYIWYSDNKEQLDRNLLLIDK